VLPKLKLFLNVLRFYITLKKPDTKLRPTTRTGDRARTGKPLTLVTNLINHFPGDIVLFSRQKRHDVKTKKNLD